LPYAGNRDLGNLEMGDALVRLEGQPVDAKGLGVLAGVRLRLAPLGERRLIFMAVQGGPFLAVVGAAQFPRRGVARRDVVGGSEGVLVDRAGLGQPEFPDDGPALVLDAPLRCGVPIACRRDLFGFIKRLVIAGADRRRLAHGGSGAVAGDVNEDLAEHLVPAHLVVIVRRDFGARPQAVLVEDDALLLRPGINESAELAVADRQRLVHAFLRRLVVPERQVAGPRRAGAQYGHYACEQRDSHDLTFPLVLQHKG
jgi:hypothetical protein